MPTRSNSGGMYITVGSLHESVLRAMLLEESQWYESFAKVRYSLLNDSRSRVVVFGPERCIPPSLIPGLNSQTIYSRSFHTSAGADASRLGSTFRPDNDIAVIGMSCNLPGAEDLEQFWDILVEGQSQHKEVPKERFGFKTTFREADTKRKWYGNFITDHDVFDHKFFKRSPRESATMDPQQRLLLQAAYQAVEQSGYYRRPRSDEEKHIGCYIGVCATDYENNIASHAPNAFAVTGNRMLSSQY
jgi:hypothetical protein